MLILALDSSSLTLSCALVEVAEVGAPGERAESAVRVLAESLHPPPDKAGDLLPQALEAVCAQSGKRLDEVSAMAVGTGPGSFTGLRIGIAAAKGLCYARRWPLAGASSLHALALAAAPHARAGQLIISTAEARRGELYAASWRSTSEHQYNDVITVHAVAAEAVYRAEAFAALLRGLEEVPLVVGPGAAACADQLSAAGVDLTALAPPDAPRTPSAAAIARLCAPALRGASFDAVALFALAPNYFKPSEAEIALSEGRVGGLPASSLNPQTVTNRSVR